MRFRDRHHIFTGLAEPRRFEHELERQINDVAGGGGESALLMIDVGARFEEPQIATLAQMLRRRVRGSDLVARTARGEFAVLLHHTDRAHAICVADSLLDAIHIEATARWNIASAASIGLAVTEDVSPLAPTTLADAADLAMAEAKRADRDRLAIYDPRRHELRHVSSRAA
ncbi:MAG: diguanylate cyclase [Solirubrobacterales bacterium]